MRRVSRAGVDTAKAEEESRSPPCVDRKPLSKDKVAFPSGHRRRGYEWPEAKAWFRWGYAVPQ